MSRICYNCHEPLTSMNTYANTGSVCKECNSEMVYVGKWKRAGANKIAAQLEKKMNEIKLLCKADILIEDPTQIQRNGFENLNTLVLDRVTKLLAR